MTVLVDRRIGSKDLLEPLRKLGLVAELTELEFGDVAFVGKGEKGTPLDIGIELKRLGDLIGSLRDGRLAGHQLPGLLKTYEHTWLLVEGAWRSGAHGELLAPRRGRGWVTPPGRMSAHELTKQLLTLELRGGLHVEHTTTRTDTLHFLVALYHWWTDVTLDDHRSHLAIHRPPTLAPIGQFRETVTTLPGIGLRTSLAVRKHFRSLRRAFAAPVKEWAAIIQETEDRKVRFGEKRAARVVAAIEEEHT